MQKSTPAWASAATAALLVLAACQNNSDELAPDQGQNGALIPGSYLVKYKSESLPAARRAYSGAYLQEVKAMEIHTQSYLRRLGIEVEAGEITQTYVGDFAGFAARLSGAEAERLRNRPEVEYVEEDRVWVLDDGFDFEDFWNFPGIEAEVKGVAASVQSVPWGITRVGGPADGTGKVAWVIDTGVDQTHPDLNVDQARSAEFVWFGPGANDKNDGHGHGTHVAGTIGAKNDGNGVVGVAAGATIVGVKVLADNGSGSTSDIVRGCNYVANNGARGDVANLSLGGSTSTSLDNAVKAIAAKGIYTCVAAGNSARPAGNYSPSRANATRLYTISAFGEGDVFASFSNYGTRNTNSPVDYAEPGVNVLSCYKGGQYATMSGTSMASPHAAGILLVRGGSFGTGGKVTGDKDNVPDTIGTR